MAERSDTHPLVVVTPATRFGSWAWIEKILAEIPNRETIVVTYGSSPTAPSSVRFVSLPSPIDYGRWGVKLAERRYLALNVLYYAPLIPVAWWTVLRNRPRTLLANGVFGAAILGPVAGRRRLVLAFHGTVEHAGSRWHGILRRALGRVDIAFVNSTGSAEDLALAINPKRIRIIEHWADEVFFDVPLERAPAEKLRVLWVGRMDSEKFTQCLRVCKKLAAEGTLTLTTVGGGPLAPEVRGPGLEHHGYVADTAVLAKHFAEADVVWGAADVSYVTLPGIEALAAGCPLLISDVPAVFTHAEAGQKVPRTIIPDEVGAVVDGDDDGEAIALLRKWHGSGISLETRRACREYARSRHTARNIEPVVEALDG